jgi:hypothetical protein
MFNPAGSPAKVVATGVSTMEKPIIICFECQKRTTVEEIKSGCHSHADVLELESPFDPAVNADD